jgi:hypothetical protein
MMNKVLFTVTAALMPLLLGCGDLIGPRDSGRVAVRFQAVTPTGAPAVQSVNALTAADHVPASGAITLVGTNGTLVIQDIRLIVAEIELERADRECYGRDDDGCEKFEGGPFLVNLLDGRPDEVVNALIPAGLYTEFEFEVERLDIDDDDDIRERQAKQAVLNQIRQAYPAFPSKASMVVHGTFNGQPFTVYFDAEIEVEKEFARPFRVPEDGVITVNLNPAAWFQVGAQVMDLRALNGRTIEFEVEFKRGVLSVEIDR